MHNIILTESELKELKYLIAETKEFKSTTITNPIIQLGYSEEEYRLINN